MPDTQPRSAFEVILLPLAIAIVGIVSTQMITRAQLKSADRIAAANVASENQRADAEQQIKILEMFSDQIKSDDAAKRKMALRILTALEPDVAEKLAQAVADTDSDQATRDVANSVVQAVAGAANSFVVIGSDVSFEESKNTLANLQKKNGDLPYTPEIYLSENHLYALTLGGHLTAVEAKRRLPAARSLVAGAYLRANDTWGPNLLH